MKKTFKTNNYEQFSHYEFNREVINELNIKAIMQVMREFGFDEWNPIIVSASGKIADGQHRLEAAKRLGIDVWVDQFDREFTADEVRRMNKNRVNWKAADFIHSQINDECAVRMYSFMLKELEMLKTYIPNSTNAMFVGAYMRAKSCENYSLETFIKKLQLTKFTCYTRMLDLINEIEEVYNFKNKNKITIDRAGLRTR